MVDADLKKIGRRELLDMLADQEEEIEKLRSHLVDAEKQLADRRICIDQAGSIAEAAMGLNGIFEAAETAASQYLENIADLNARQEKICADREEKSKAEAASLLEDARQKAAAMLEAARVESENILGNARRLEGESRNRCELMVAKAKRESEEYWIKVSRQVEQFCQTREELKSLLSVGRFQSSEQIIDL